jgi:hypothetical protein
MNGRQLFDIGFGVILLTMVSSPALAWGPEVHFFLGSRLLELGLVGGALGRVLLEHRERFLFGNTVGDVVVGKGYLDEDDHSHNWSVSDNLFDLCETDADEAFAYGFYSHLAADTIAHNRYVPEFNGTLLPSTKAGHVYWEMRAGSRVPLEYKDDLKELLEGDFSREKSLLEDAMPASVLPFSANWSITNGVLELFSHRSWHHFSNGWNSICYTDIDGEVDPYLKHSLHRMQLLFGDEDDRKKVHSLEPHGH